MFRRALIVSAGVLALIVARPANATILTFQNLALGTISQDYGDNVTGTSSGGFTYGGGAEGFTPNITVTWALRTALGSSAGAVVPNVVTSGNLLGFAEYVNAQVDAQNPVLEIRFTPTAGTTVALLDFVVGRSATGTVGGRQYALYDNTYSPLVSPTTYSNPGGTGSTVNVALNYAGLAGQELIFQIKLTDVLGIDNFRFSQVPEPSGIALAAVVGIGAGLLQWQRRRKHRLAKAAAIAAAETPTESV